MFGLRRSSDYLERAEIAAKQMRYFRLFSQKGAPEDLESSARRAGFEFIDEDIYGPAVSFRWVSSEPADFTFFVSFDDPENAFVSAESHGDIFGLTMTSISTGPKIEVETKTWLAKHEFGPNAHLFRKLLLTFPDFADAGEKKLLRFKF